MNAFFKKRRIIGLSLLGALCIIITIYSYFKLALLPVAGKAKNKQTAERGSIVDRSGFPLAVQTTFYRIGLNTKDIKNKENFCKAMAPVLDMSEDELFEKIDKKREYVILKKKATSAEYDLISSVTIENDFTYVNFEKLPGRVYPNYALASQLIGYMGNEGIGLAGVEFSQQDVLSPTLKDLEEGKLNPEKQGDTDTNYARMLTKADGNIDWTRSAEEIERLIRGLNPWPSAYTDFNGKSLKIWKAVVSETCDDGNPLCFRTGNGYLFAKEVQLEGKKRMTAEAFLLGYKR